MIMASLWRILSLNRLASSRCLIICASSFCVALATHVDHASSLVFSGKTAGIGICLYFFAFCCLIRSFSLMRSSFALSLKRLLCVFICRVAFGAAVTCPRFTSPAGSTSKAAFILQETRSTLFFFFFFYVFLLFPASAIAGYSALRALVVQFLGFASALLTLSLESPIIYPRFSISLEISTLDMSASSTTEVFVSFLEAATSLR